MLVYEAMKEIMKKMLTLRLLKPTSGTLEPCIYSVALVLTDIIGVKGVRGQEMKCSKSILNRRFCSVWAVGGHRARQVRSVDELDSDFLRPSHKRCS